MWRIALWRALNLFLVMVSATALCAAVAALSAPAATGFLRAWSARLWGFTHGDFGSSLVTGGPALTAALKSLVATLALAGSGAVVALVLGGIAGLLFAGGRGLRGAAILVQCLAAVPVFCAGLAFLWLWAHGPLRDGAGLWATRLGPFPAAFIEQSALPVLTVGMAGAGAVQLALRRSASGALGQPWRKGLRLLGLTQGEIDRHYLAPELLAGLLSGFGEVALALLSATAVAESLFGWPGAAVLFLKSVALHDWNVVAVVLLAFAAMALAAETLGTIAGRGLFMAWERT